MRWLPQRVPGLPRYWRPASRPATPHRREFPFAEQLPILAAQGDDWRGGGEVNSFDDGVDDFQLILVRLSATRYLDGVARF